jgi:hypothetical protein
MLLAVLNSAPAHRGEDLVAATPCLLHGQGLDHWHAASLPGSPLADTADLPIGTDTFGLESNQGLLHPSVLPHRAALRPQMSA